MRKQYVVLILFLGILSFIWAMSYAATASRNGQMTALSGRKGFRVGPQGTRTDLFRHGTLDIPNGGTSKEISVPGLLPGDKIFLSPAESLATAVKYHAVATTDTLTATVNANPGTTVTLNYLAVGP